jgi:hypothetical protein
MLGSRATDYLLVLAGAPRYCEGGVGRRISTVLRGIKNIHRGLATAIIQHVRRHLIDAWGQLISELGDGVAPNLSCWGGRKGTCWWVRTLGDSIKL